MDRVFFLEDSQTHALLLRHILERHGCEVVGRAETGPEAVRQAVELMPDFLFIDVILKDENMDGIDAAMEMRKSLDAPIIFVTSYSNKEIVDRALAVSPHAYILKPVEEDQLRVTLETVRKRVSLEKERRELTDQLYQSQKMRAIGQMAGGVAHNFNNILTTLLGNAEMALRGTADDDPNFDRISKILKSGYRARDLTMKLLSLARKEKFETKPLILNDVICDLTEILAGSIPKNIVIESFVEEGRLVVRANANQLTQALLNVCFNACDSMPNGGILAIEAKTAPALKKQFVNDAGDKPGEYCVVRIGDTGTGIPRDIKQKIFEPFFTTKEKEKGTGLGLYVTLGIVQDHNGFMEVETEEGTGTTMSVFLPVTEEDAALDEERPETRRRAGSETIFIVDDEEDFLDMISEALQLDGYRTFIANSGKKALKMFQELRGEIDLVLLDIMMPGMDGCQVYRAIRKIAPDAKVVLCSGYSDDKKVGDLMSEGISAFLQKPFNSEELGRTLSNILTR